MLDGVEAGAAQNVEYIVPEGYRSCGQPIDVSLQQIVRVLVVGAEHHPAGVGGDQGVEGVKVAGRRAFSDQDAHPRRQLVLGLFEGGALVVGADSRLGVTPCRLPRQSGGMAVHGEATVTGQSELGEDRGVLVENRGEVHHLGKVQHLRPVEQGRDLVASQRRTGGFEVGRRHAGRRAEEDLEVGGGGVFQHVAHTVNTEYVRYFVRVRNRGHRAVSGRDAAELRRHQHRAFDVDVGIDEAREKIVQRGILGAGLVDRDDAAPIPPDSH